MQIILTGAPLRRSVLSIALGCIVSAGAFAAAPGNTPQALAQVRDTALQSDWAYARLADMTDLIGPRLSGSAGAAAAVQQVADAMRQLGATVTLQPVKVPHWVRGVETAEIVDYAGRPQGVSQRVVLTALGGSGATAAAGLTAPVIIVKSLDELKARAPEVKGAIVLIDTPFDQEMAERGLAGVTYGQGSRARFLGPKAAADLGAAAALVRSVGGANFRIPHAGATGLDDNKRIPAAAVTVEDALLIGRLAARGPLKMHLTLTPQNLPEADSYNVIADWPGTDKASEVVVVSGHLDSWDLATGAHDDGAGVVAAMGVVETLKKLDYRPRRTIRVIAWMNEENGGRGGQAYFEAHKQALGKQYAAIEMDSGAGRPFGILASVGPKSEKLFAPLRAALLPMGAHAFTRRDALGTGDLHRLETGGVPSFEPLVDSHSYFHYHHTPADTLDKVDPDNLKRNVALMASLAWFLANIDGEIGRAPEQGE
ncbi:aminopeptidase YwaD precursor [Janthinobacterium sp. HH103]|uniref:M20/M25/M40 family metallo-hydrolase n=1 Tax=unclassified Janthinobacterium TaxID=2610881 RepID=UPI00087446E9|nr:MULTISPECIES: M20/M25/M40 family metallo-hydrolase [unclassified Janthinobacterium]OEZ55183.1 aminopeptidase YwaD precursor [Janthinobacterium sp. HH100]OEZ67497.1 aminopeptidase YwaD precursor [Janthinobacterium sp. HH103]QOU74355.1 Aminopeptidase YwaD [Janthinobacterium sp. HH102]